MAVCGVASSRRRLRRFHPISRWELDRHTPCLSAVRRCPERVFRQKRLKIVQIYVTKAADAAAQGADADRINSCEIVSCLEGWQMASRCSRGVGGYIRIPLGCAKLARPAPRHAARQSTGRAFYRYVAQELDEPALCDEIPWSAESPGGFFIAPSYERSNCYAFIAGRTKNPGSAGSVKRLGAFRLLSQQTSMWSCVADARRGMNAGIGVAP